MRATPLSYISRRYADANRISTAFISTSCLSGKVGLYIGRSLAIITTKENKVETEIFGFSYLLRFLYFTLKISCQTLFKNDSFE